MQASDFRNFQEYLDSWNTTSGCFWQICLSGNMLLLRPNSFFFLEHYFGDKHRVMCKKFSTFIYIFYTFSNNSVRYHLNYTFQKQPPEVFCEKGVLRNFIKFSGKYLCQSLFFNKVAGLRQIKEICRIVFNKYAGLGVFLWILRNF